MSISDYFEEFERHLLRDEKPSCYFNALADSREFPADYPLTLLTDLKQVPQSPVHHPEGNVWNHTMLVVDRAADRKSVSKDARVLMWAALLHDLGKITNTKVQNGKISAYDHDADGEKLARSFLEACTQDETFIKKVCALVRWHMQMLYVIKHLPFSNIKKMKTQTDINEVALLSFCDRLGRGELTPSVIEQELKNVEYFLQKCGKV